jgi:hypothetical protein
MRNWIANNFELIEAGLLLAGLVAFTLVGILHPALMGN